MKIADKRKKRKGAALVVAILLSAIIGTAAIGLTAIAFRQVHIGETYNNGTAAFYAAESGLEEGLLRNKYDKNTEIPATVDAYFAGDTLLHRPANVYRNILASTPMQKQVDETGTALGYSGNLRSQIYDLQSYYKQTFDGATASNGLQNYSPDSTYKIAKDNSLTLSVNSGSAGDVTLLWKWITATCNGKPRALEIKLKDSTGNEHTALYRDPTCPNIANAELAPTAPGGISGIYQISGLRAKMGISALEVSDLTLKPVGGADDGIYFGFFQSDGDKRNTSGLATTINSTGYFGGASRQITANINRQSGTIMDIFNYVLYKGH